MSRKSHLVMRDCVVKENCGVGIEVAGELTLEGNCEIYHNYSWDLSERDNFGHCEPGSWNTARNISTVADSPSYSSRPKRTPGKVNGVPEDLDIRRAWPIGILKKVPALVLPSDMQTRVDRHMQKNGYKQAEEGRRLIASGSLELMQDQAAALKKSIEERSCAFC